MLLSQPKRGNVTMCNLPPYPNRVSPPLLCVLFADVRPISTSLLQHRRSTTVIVIWIYAVYCAHLTCDKQSAVQSTAMKFTSCIASTIRFLGTYQRREAQSEVVDRRLRSFFPSSCQHVQIDLLATATSATTCGGERSSLRPPRHHTFTNT